jgi:hypothetical protein
MLVSFFALYCFEVLKLICELIRVQCFEVLGFVMVGGVLQLLQLVVFHVFYLLFISKCQEYDKDVLMLEKTKFINIGNRTDLIFSFHFRISKVFGETKKELECF